MIEQFLKEILIKKYAILHPTSEIPKHDCIKESVLVSNVLSAKEIRCQALAIVGLPLKFGKKKTRRKCQAANKKYKEKLWAVVAGLWFGNSLRGSNFRCKICDSRMPYFDTLAKKIFQI